MAYITLDKHNFFNNLDIITSLCGGKDKIAFVLKDNAYGHGLCEMAKMAQEYGIKRAVVRTHKEAVEVYGYFDTILVLADIPKKADTKIIYTLNDSSKLEQFAHATRVHVKVDTGMGRNGVGVQELEKVLHQAKQNGLHVEGVFTHHCCADESGGDYEKQKQRFETIQKSLDAKYPELVFHSQNSAALFREGKCSGEFVRVGIAAYGCLELPFESEHTTLKPVLSLYAHRISTRQLEAGECVGYSATFRAQEHCVVSNYDFGYADGFLRACSNDYITPQGVHIAGRISMDNSSFLSEDEELLIFDDAKKVAPYAKTIPYEILTSLKGYLPRKII